MSLFDKREIIEAHHQFAGNIKGSIRALAVCCDLIRKVLLDHSYKSQDEISLSLLGFRIVSE